MKLIASLLGVFLLSTSVLAQPIPIIPSQQGAPAVSILKSITVKVTGSSVGGGWECSGFVYTVGSNFAIVVTAKHCINPGTLNVVFRNHWGPQAVERTITNPTYDVAVLIVHLWTLPPGMGVENADGRTTTGHELVLAWDGSSANDPLAGLVPRQNRSVYSEDQYVGNLTPIFSMLTAGSGNPVISSGELLPGSGLRAALPGAEGSSGAPVLDARGNLVGIIKGMIIPGGVEAGWKTTLVPGNVVRYLVQWAMAHCVFAIPIKCASSLLQGSGSMMRRLA